MKISLQSRVFVALSLAVAIAAVASHLLIAQEAPSPVAGGVAQPAASTEEIAAARAAFTVVNDEWKESLEAIRAIQIQFQTAAPADQVVLRQEYADMLPKVREKAEELIAAAERLYAIAPNADREVSNLLLLVVPDMVQDDRYEDALRVSRLLIDGQAATVDSPEVFIFAGVSAYETANYDQAEQYFRTADDRGILNPDLPEKPEGWQELVYRAMDSLQQIPTARLQWDAELATRATEAMADDLPRVKLETSEGTIVVELFENEAPNTVANYISLVEKGYYNGTPFHRVLPSFMAQGGDPTGTGTGDPGYRIECECYEPNARRHFRGSLSMAHSGRDTGGSQFFMTFVRTPFLDEKTDAAGNPKAAHTVFGRVIEGLDVLSRIERIDPEKPSGKIADRIISATVERKRDHEYQPMTLPK